MNCLLARHLHVPVVLQICGGLEDEESMLLCDGCDRGCHLPCAQLKSMLCAPTWHCADCDRRAQQQQQQPGNQRLKKRVSPVALVTSSDDSDLSSDGEYFRDALTREVAHAGSTGRVVLACRTRATVVCLPTCFLLSH